ncbi:MAG: prepilin-type N-terminal cleavage/methylation domain-containing protein [Deltaproteobacteria bacterium]
MSRGFTLVEVLVVTAIGAFIVLTATQVAQSVVVGAQKASQQTDTVIGSELALRQLRADLASTGVASGGAVAVDPNVAPWASLVTPTAGGRSALPVVSGADNVITTNVGASRVLDGSDVLQVLAIDPLRRTAASNLTPRGARRVMVDDLDPIRGCTLLHLADHSAPAGLPRSQLAFVAALNTEVELNGRLLFDLAPGSEVSCARLSTYWVDGAHWLRRTDLTATPSLVRLQGVAIDATGATGEDHIAVGVADLQVAYRVSPELFTLRGLAAPTSAADAWLHDTPGVGLSGAEWFEVREVRANLVFRRARRLDASADLTLPPLENGPPRTIVGSYRPFSRTLAVPLRSLELFDLRSPSGLTVEPY